MRFVNFVSLFAKQKNSKFSLLLPAVTAYVMFINETHRSIFGVHSNSIYCVINYFRVGMGLFTQLSSLS